MISIIIGIIKIIDIIILMLRGWWMLVQAATLVGGWEGGGQEGPTQYGPFLLER